MITDEDSRLFDNARFPLMVMVVFIHCSIGASFRELDILGKIVGAVCACAVPLYFVISGCLFFNGIDENFAHSYTRKLKSRVYTLLVPYLIWNIVTIAYLWAGEILMPWMASGANTPVSSYGAQQWIRAFWDLRGGMPVCYPFWFIRDLMIMNLLSPVFYIVIRKTGILLPAALGIFYICGFRTGITGLSEMALFFYSLGAWYSLGGGSISADCKRLPPVPACLYCIILGTLTYMYICGKGDDTIPYRAISFVGMCLAAGLLSKKKKSPNALLQGSSFFIYATHAIVLAIVARVLCAVIPVTTAASACIVYLMCPVFTVALCIGLYALAKKLLPRATAIATGSRL